ncbi:MAG: hypothetical protein ACYTEQ_11435 [Planctomycetota bacterium]|jgi:hypothetical protein
MRTKRNVPLIVIVALLIIVTALLGKAYAQSYNRIIFPVEDRKYFIPNIDGAALWAPGDDGELFFSDSNQTREANDLYYDDANGWLGIGTLSPRGRLDVNGAIWANGDLTCGTRGAYTLGTNGNEFGGLWIGNAAGTVRWLVDTSGANPQFTSSTGVLNFNDDDFLNVGNITAAGTLANTGAVNVTNGAVTISGTGALLDVDDIRIDGAVISRTTAGDVTFGDDIDLDNQNIVNGNIITGESGLTLQGGGAGAITADSVIRPGSDGTIDLGAVGSTDYRWRHLYLSGNLSDEINALTIGDAKSAYDHSQDNTQAHSDYLLNNASDETSGTITAGGFTTAAGAVSTATLTTSGNAQLGNAYTDYHGLNIAPASGSVLTIGDFTETSTSVDKVVDAHLRTQCTQAAILDFECEASKTAITSQVIRTTYSKVCADAAGARNKSLYAIYGEVRGAGTGSTGAVITGGTHNWYAGYFACIDADAANKPSGGTINLYGLYVGDSPSNYGTGTTYTYYGLYIDDANAGDPDTKYAIYTAGADSDVFLEGSISALDVTDRTPAWPGTSEEALDAVVAIQSRDGKVDHNSLPESCQRTLTEMRPTGEYTKDDIPILEPVEVSGRSLSAMVSLLVESTKALQAENEALKARVAELEKAP